MHRSKKLHPGAAASSAFGFALVLLLPAVCCTGRPATVPQNVLLITLDTTRADFLSAYGHLRRTTPNLDALAQQGTRFDLAISTAAVTPVSHASILTGLDNHRHGLRVLSADGGFRLPPQVPTLATLLRRAGYSTLAVHSAFPVSAHFGLDQGFEIFDSFEARIRVEKEGRAKHSWPVAKLQRRADETTEIVLRHLATVAEPFLLWVHYWDPHDPARLPPAEFMAEASEELEVPRQRRVYAAEVRYMDAQIGRLLASLRASGLEARTLIAVVSDHGEGLGDHGWRKHRILYQEQIRVPLILRVPDREQVPVVSELVRITDLLPTILDYLRIEPPAGISGRSLRDLIEGRGEPGRIAFADQINGFDFNADLVETRPFDDFLYCAMDRDWKLVYRPTHPDRSELYHLAVDAGERHNLYSERPREVARLLRELADQEPWVLAPFTASGAVEDLTAVREALSALGYLGGDGDPAAALQWAWFCPDRPGRLRGDRRQGDCPTPLVPILPSADGAP